MDKISQILGGDTGIYEIVETKQTTNNKGEVVYSEDVDTADYAKKNIKKVIDTGMRALPDMIRVLQDSDNPKMFSAASSFMESLTKINMQYAELDKPAGGEKVITATQHNTTNYNYMTSEAALAATSDAPDTTNE